MHTDQQRQAGEMRLHCGGHRVDKQRLTHNTGSEAGVISFLFVFVDLRTETYIK